MIVHVAADMITWRLCQFRTFNVYQLWWVLHCLATQPGHTAQPSHAVPS